MISDFSVISLFVVIASVLDISGFSLGVQGNQPNIGVLGQLPFAFRNETWVCQASQTLLTTGVAVAMLTKWEQGNIKSNKSDDFGKDTSCTVE